MRVSKPTIKIDISRYTAEINGKMTFHYAVKSLYNKGLSSRWKASSTVRQYNVEFNTILFPNITDKVPLEELTKEYFDKIIETIIDNYYLTHNKLLSESRIRHYKYLIRKVVSTAASNGVCDDYLWGTQYSLGEDDTDKGEEREKSVLQTIQKSLKPIQELKIFNRIMISPLQAGQKIGLAIMFCCGVRNEEACGLNYEDLIEIPSHKGCYCLRIYKTTYQDSNDLKGKGKTANAYRVIPIPKSLADLLIARKKHLENLFKTDKLNTSVDELPIVCNGNELNKRCIANHLTAAGRQLFKDIEADEKLIQAAEEELTDAYNSDIDRDDEIVQKKEATTYLLRRNFATHLMILGLSDAEIHYLMGHKIENRSFNRNDLNNPDKLYAMHQKLNQRPLLGAPNYDHSNTTKISNMPLNITAKNIFDFEACGEIYIQLTTAEPNDDLSIRFDKSANIAIEGKYSVMPCDEEYSKNASVMAEYHSAYKTYESKKKSMLMVKPGE